jgi:hypothetical protein
VQGQAPDTRVSKTTSPYADWDASLFDDQAAHAVSDEDDRSPGRLVWSANASRIQTAQTQQRKVHIDVSSILIERIQ